MGIVYLAISSGLAGFSKLFVIKELKPELVEDQSLLDMFLEEARLAARLNHPNIVPTYEVGIDGNRPFIVMDYLEGQTLARLINKTRPKEGAESSFTLDMHLAIISEALEGLHYAHNREDFDGSTLSIVHRDVSPQNLFVTYDGQVKVVDFGIAKASDTTIETRTGIFKGKPSYMAPEQVQGDVDPRTDVFAVGVMLWEAVARRRMWPKKTDVEILTNLIKKAIPKLEEAAPDAPAELVRIVSKAVAPNVDDRYASAKALRTDLEAYLETRSPRPSLKEIGGLVAKTFAKQREQLRTIIEACIAESKSSDASSQTMRSKLPSIAPPDENSGPSSPSSPSGSSSSLSPSSGTKRMSLGAPISSRTPPASSRTPVSTRSQGAGPLSGVTPTGASVDASLITQAAPPASNGIRPLHVVIGGAIAAALVVVLVVLVRRDVSPSGKSDAPPPSSLHDDGTPADLRTKGADANNVNANASATAATTTDASGENATALGSASAKPPTIQTRIVYVHTPPPPPPKPTAAKATATATTATTTAPPIPTPQPASNKPDCNPPFYFEGNKKVYKPGCL